VWRNFGIHSVPVVPAGAGKFVGGTPLPVDAAHADVLDFDEFVDAVLRALADEAGLLDPAITLAPPTVASAMCSSTFATAPWSIIGPCVTPGSVPGPTLSERTFAANFSAKSS
jgi:hypothetical protein